MTAPIGSSGPSGALASLVRLRGLADSGLTRALDWRLERLASLRDALLDAEDALVAALDDDLGKPATESFITDFALVVAEIDHVRRHLAQWVRPRTVRLPLVQRPGRATVQLEPLGVVLVVAPWNYPVYLSLMPTISAIAAGNCVLVKPSELAPATAEVLQRLLGDGSGMLGTAGVGGGPAIVHELLEAGVDHVFFTGSSRVGSIVAEAAGRRLIPVTLELGGKCPAYVDASADLRSAARRIAWAKYVNAGQTCVAPDYVLVHCDVAETFAAEFVAVVHTMFGAHPHRSADYARIVDASHLARLAELLATSRGEVILGGVQHLDDRYFAPTVVRDPDRASRLMTEEIFGPILPLVTVAGPDAALAVIRARADPLAVYVFAEQAHIAAQLRDATRSGAFCVNTAMTQLGVTGLAFGGVGASGSGVSHGRWGVAAFSQSRSVVSRRSRPEIGLHMPPYSLVRTWLVRRALGVPGGGREATGRQRRRRGAVLARRARRASGPTS